MAVRMVSQNVGVDDKTGKVYVLSGGYLRPVPNQQAAPQQQQAGAGMNGLGVAGGKLAGKLLFGGGVGAEELIPTVTGTEGALMSPATLDAAGVEFLTPGQAGIETGAGLGSYVLPVAGAAGLYDLFKNKRTGGRGLLQGAASGAAVGSALGPWGTGIGAVVGGLGSLLNREPQTEVEDKRWRSLIDKGLIPKEWVPKGIGEATTGSGKPFEQAWSEAQSPEDKAKMLWGYAGLSEKFGADYWKAGEKARMDVAKLFAGGEPEGAIREHHGTVDFNWTPERETAAKNIIMEALKRGG